MSVEPGASSGSILLTPFTLSLMNHCVRLLSCALLLSNATKIEAQDWRTFGGFANDQLDAIAHDASGNIIVAGTTGSMLQGAAGFCGWLAKLDSNGDTLWSRSYAPGNGFNLINDVLVTDAGDLICAGTRDQGQALVFATDGSGVPLWSYSTYAVPFMNAITSSMDGGFFTVGSPNSGNNADIMLYKLTGTGTTTWSTRLNTGYEDVAIGVTATPDSGAIVSGSTRSTGPLSDGLIAKFDKNGTLEWCRAYGNANPGDLKDIVVLPSGGYVAVGTYAVGGTTNYRPLLLRIDAAGDTLWTRSLEGYPDGRGMQVDLIDQQIVLLTEHHALAYGDYNLTVLDTSGNYIASHTYSTSNRDYPQEMMVLPDGRIALIGKTYRDVGTSGPGVGADDGFLVIVNADASSSCEAAWTPPPMVPAQIVISVVGSTTMGSSLSVDASLPLHGSVHPLITEVCATATNIPQDEESPFQVFLNSTDRTLVVQVDGNGRMHQIELLNVLGQVVKGIGPFTSNVSIDVSDLHAGAYLVCVYDGRVLRTRKVVVW